MLPSKAKLILTLIKFVYNPFMKFVFVFFVLLLSGCSIKNYVSNQSKLIVIKSPKIKFADLGYVRNTDDKIQVQMFIAGKMVQQIEINHLVCVNEWCYTKNKFNEEYLHYSYPENLLQNVILGKSIYNAENKLATQEGFEQFIESNDVQISYKVSKNQIFFKDKKNKIFFKIKAIR